MRIQQYNEAIVDKRVEGIKHTKRTTAKNNNNRDMTYLMDKAGM
jgi:hypothetical protein